MKISVIIPTYNRAPFLPHAIRSLQRQSGDFTLDMLVVDDGSSDGTDALLAGISATEPRLRHVRQENAGVAAARNTGLRHLPEDADFVTFLDSDDLMPEGRINADLAAFRADPALDLTYGQMTRVAALDYERLGPEYGTAPESFTGIHMSCAMMRSALVQRNGTFAEDLRQAEDVDYLFRIFESGAPWRLTDSNCLYYLQHEGGLTRNVAEARRFFMMALLRSTKRKRESGLADVRMPPFRL
jgi:glycosyltransferase involved in cell wall biosynthesis